MLININSFCNNYEVAIYHYHPSFSDVIWGHRELTNFSKVTQLISGRVKIPTQGQRILKKEKKKECIYVCITDSLR